MKCHNIESERLAEREAGRASRCTQATSFHASLSSADPRRQGEKCIDCHVRIPHAWQRPRLLVRTVVTTDGVEPDAYPYVRAEPPRTARDRPQELRRSDRPQVSVLRHRRVPSQSVGKRSPEAERSRSDELLAIAVQPVLQEVKR